MSQKNQSENSKKRIITIEWSWRSAGYLGAIFLLIFAFGMQTALILPYAPTWAFVFLGVGLVLLAVTAPLLRKK